MQRTTVWEGAARHEVHQQLPRIEEKEKLVKTIWRCRRLTWSRVDRCPFKASWSLTGLIIMLAINQDLSPSVLYFLAYFVLCYFTKWKWPCPFGIYFKKHSLIVSENVCWKRELSTSTRIHMIKHLCLTTLGYFNILRWTAWNYTVFQKTSTFIFLE